MKKKQTFVLMMFVSLNAMAFGQKLPASSPAPISSAPSPVAPVQPVREPAAISSLVPPVDMNVFTEISEVVGHDVDQYYQSYRELLPIRNAQESYQTDKCDVNLSGHDRFAERISYAVYLKMYNSTAGVDYVSSYFGLKSDAASYAQNSLLSHPLCRVTASTLNTTFGGKNIPSASTIKKANDFANLMNQYRREAIAGNRDSFVKAEKLWTRFMMCLSYTESLTTADTSSAARIAQKYAPTGYRRPAGVNFYEDPYQPIESRLNIGLYQFAPDSSGNIQACIREWNNLYPSCSVNRKAQMPELIKIFGSSLQTFNAFCGAAKVTGMFSVQINTTKIANTHPDNVNSNGTLKQADERCVTPHMNTTRSYNHFGPFQNSVGTNMDELLTCTMAP